MPARIISDSVNQYGERLTTFEIKVHRYIWSEFLTHRVFARNAASSRARPIQKVIDSVCDDIAVPLVWGTAQPGMQAGPPLEGDLLNEALDVWIEAASAAVDYATILQNMNVSKEVVNRVLEPYSYTTAIITGSEFQNFFTQRCNSDAQAEIRIPAEKMRELYESSEPKLLKQNEWHLPYIQENEKYFDTENLKKLSAARCARVSYLSHDGKRDVSKDFELFTRLVTHGHWSPLEHVCRPADLEENPVGPFARERWHCFRHEFASNAPQGSFKSPES